jgi:hypothetical protein
MLPDFKMVSFLVKYQAKKLLGLYPGTVEKHSVLSLARGGG